MYENRTTYPKKKTQMYQQLQELPKKYNVIALVRMEKVRASQLLPLRKKLQGEVEIFSVKDKVARLALEKAGVTGVDKFIDKLEGQCLFMFTNMSPFKLNVLLGKNKVMLFARGGDNVQDPWFPAGNFDPLALMSASMTMAQAAPWERLGLSLFTTGAARLMGLEWDGTFRIGSKADFILIDARCWASAMSTPPSRKVMINGHWLQKENISS